MTNKITREEAEKEARLCAYRAVAFGNGAAPEEPEMDGEPAYIAAMDILTPRIIPKSPWRPIEECPAYNDPDSEEIFFIRKDDLVACASLDEKGLWVEVHSCGVLEWFPLLFMEIPALPDEVAR